MYIDRLWRREETPSLPWVRQTTLGEDRPSVPKSVFTLQSSENIHEKRDLEIMWLISKFGHCRWNNIHSVVKRQEKWMRVIFSFKRPIIEPCGTPLSNFPPPPFLLIVICSFKLDLQKNNLNYPDHIIMHSEYIFLIKACKC